VLLFHPPEAESRLASRALGFRLWPQVGATAGERYANAFRQAPELGYEGAVVIRVDTPAVPVELVTEAAALLEEHHGVIVPDADGGIALLALQEPQPTIFSGATRPGYDEILTRARQQLVRLVELAVPEARVGTVGASRVVTPNGAVGSDSTQPNPIP
jgi:glycosyltransferase A (GT-A) superfamily protein (DUF2064 family)